MINRKYTDITTELYLVKGLNSVNNHKFTDVNQDANINYDMTTSDYLNLLIIEDGGNQRLIDLEENTYYIGRSLDNSIIISDRQVSRHHATIVKQYSSDKKAFFYQVVDGKLNGKASKNGLYINGKKYQQKYLQHGDFIRFSEKAAARYFLMSKDYKITDIFNLMNCQTIDLDSLVQKDQEINQDIDKATVNLDQDFLHLVDQDQYDYLSKLASFSELSPYPIIEVNLQGKITYCNQAASLTFPDLKNKQLNHPILTDILKSTNKIYASLFVREITIKNQTFEQYIHYLPQLKLIRSYIFDFTKRKTIEQELRDSEAKYKAVVQQINEGIFLVDAKTKRIIETNEAASQLLGYSPQELVSLRVDHFLVNKYQEFSQFLKNIQKDNFSVRKELEYKHKKGYIIHVEISANIINYHQQEMICFVFRNISKRKQLEAKLKYTAYHDNLTKLYNRSFFNEYLHKALMNAKRDKYLMAIMFVDLDYFKDINDNYGHKLGDELLQKFAKRLQACLREGDILARWGGDEFTIFLPKIESKNDVIQISERITKSLRKPFLLAEEIVKISGSIGTAIYPQHGRELEMLLHNADVALYATKERGRNGYSIYSNSMQKTIT